jgi:hypothetical protein
MYSLHNKTGKVTFLFVFFVVFRYIAVVFIPDSFLYNTCID